MFLNLSHSNSCIPQTNSIVVISGCLDESPVADINISVFFCYISPHSTGYSSSHVSYSELPIKSVYDFFFLPRSGYSSAAICSITTVLPEILPQIKRSLPERFHQTPSYLSEHHLQFQCRLDAFHLYPAFCLLLHIICIMIRQVLTMPQIPLIRSDIMAHPLRNSVFASLALLPFCCYQVPFIFFHLFPVPVSM